MEQLDVCESAPNGPITPGDKGIYIEQIKYICRLLSGNLSLGSNTKIQRRGKYIGLVKHPNAIDPIIINESFRVSFESRSCHCAV